MNVFTGFKIENPQTFGRRSKRSDDCVANTNNAG